MSKRIRDEQTAPVETVPQETPVNGALTVDDTAARAERERKANELRGARRARFIKLAERRVNRALKAIRSVRQMANKASYDYTWDEGARIVQAVNDSVEQLAAAFDGTRAEKQEFTL